MAPVAFVIVFVLFFLLSMRGRGP